MATDNKILTALGLDITQYETGLNKAVTATNLFGRAIDGVDGGLREIPVVGRIYAATLGNIVTGFVDATVNAREFARIMSTDVKASLEGSIQQIEDINNHIKTIAESGVSRKFNEIFKTAGLLFKGQKKDDALDLIRNLFTGEKVAKEIEALDRRREELLENAVELKKREAAASSEAYSQNKLNSELARADIAFGQRKLAAEREAYQLGGPERAKWSTLVIKNLQKEISLAEDIRKAEIAAMVARNLAFKAELSSQRELAFLQHSGNARDMAAEELRLAKEKQGINKASRVATLEQMQADTARVAIAEDGLKNAQAEYAYAVHQMELQTNLMKLQGEGQTRAANQAKIRLHYETQIVYAMQHGNVELANQLKAQQRLAQVEEAKRQYLLGGKGRAAERREERKQARIDRTIQSRLNGRGSADTPGGGLRSGGLTTSGLRAGGMVPDREHIPITHMAGPTHMAKPGHMKGSTPKVTIEGMQEFVNQLFTLLGK